MKSPNCPETKAVDPRMFGADWYQQPLQARYASIDAHQVGLLVQVEMAKCSGGSTVACITWRGTLAQFQATKTFPKGVNAKRSSGKWVYPGQLRGTVYPDGEDRLLFVIEYCGQLVTPLRRAKRVQEAMSDDGYRRFREALINTTVALGDGSEHCQGAQDE